MDNLNVQLGAYTWSEVAEWAQEDSDDKDAAWQSLIDDGHEVPMEAYENDPQAYGEFMEVKDFVITSEGLIKVVPEFHLELEAC